MVQTGGVEVVLCGSVACWVPSIGGQEAFLVMSVYWACYKVYLGKLYGFWVMLSSI